MSVAGNALDLIRTVFRRDNAIPGGPSYYDSSNLASSGYGAGAMGGPESQYNQALIDSVNVDSSLMGRYSDYEQMEETAELGSAMDMYADDSTQQDILTGKSIWYESEDETVDAILNDMLHKSLRAEEDLWEIARSLVKYGNNFEEINVVDRLGAIKLNHLPAPTMRRIEDRNGVLYGYVEDPTMSFRLDTKDFVKRLSMNDPRISKDELSVSANGVNESLKVYEPWEVVHFRLRGKSRKDMYGYSVVEAGRGVWKRLVLLEDAMVLYKLTRSPQRYAFYVDVGDIPPNKARAEVNRVKNEFKKTKFVDPATGKLSFRFNPLSNDEDLFIPVRKGKKSTEIDVLSGPEGQQVDDVQYFRDKLFSAIKIPKSFLGGDETAGRGNLVQQDIHYARTVLRVQRELKNGYRHIGAVDLAARNIDPDRVAFDVRMVVPSGALELAQLEVKEARLNLADRYRSANFSEYYVWSSILDLSDEEIAEIQRQRAAEQAGGLGSESIASIDRSIDMAAENHKKKVDGEISKKVIDELQENNSDFAKRVKQLKGLTNDIRQALNSKVKRRRN